MGRPAASDVSAPDGTGERRLTAPVSAPRIARYDEAPVWAPGSDWLAFHRSEIEGCASGGGVCGARWDIFVVDRTGGGLRRITRGRAPACGRRGDRPATVSWVVVDELGLIAVHGVDITLRPRGCHPSNSSHDSSTPIPAPIASASSIRACCGRRAPPRIAPSSVQPPSPAGSRTSGRRARAWRAT